MKLDPRHYFDDLASTYDRFRPGYPAEAIAWVMNGLPDTPRVLDVGCGTGISSRLLAAGGAGAVVGIDPSPGMLELARQATDEPRITYATGQGESTGQPDHAFDLVVCAQSFHWCDRNRSLSEFRRVLRPGGRLALLWNVGDHADSFTASYQRAAFVAQLDAERRGVVVRYGRSADPGGAGWFGDIARQRFFNPHELTRDDLRGRFESASYCPPAGPLRMKLERLLDEAFERYCRDGRVTMRQYCIATIATAI